MAESLNIFAYDDYRQFLNDWLAVKKKRGRFSMRRFAAQAGFGAHDIFQLVSRGKRNLSMRSIGQFAKALQLKKDEAAYFQDLVFLNQATDPRSRLEFYQRLVSNPRRRKVVPLERAKLAFFQHWLGPVIFEMTQFPEFKPDAAWIAQQFEPPLPIGDVRRVMQDLLASGLVREQRGRWVQSAEFLDTGDNVRDVHLFAYHEHALARAADGLELPAGERYYQVSTAAVPLGSLAKIRDLAKRFEIELQQLIDSEPGARAEVMQISLQVLPVLRRRKGERP